MDGQELLELLPDTIFEQGDPERVERLRNTNNPAQFVGCLKKLAQSSRPVWCFGLPRSGSSWFGEYFFEEFLDVIYKEPFSLFHAPGSGEQETDTMINKDTSHATNRPEIQQVLDLTSTPLDRLLLAIHDEFWFYHHLDHTVINQLLKLYPQSRIIFWTRDGRDVIDSLHNPDPRHWPQIKFEFLGEESKERFEQATLRYIHHGGSHYNWYVENQDRSVSLHYEQFTHDFMNAGEFLLEALEIPFERDQLIRQREQFDARHGMWQQWEPWQLEHYERSQAPEFNQALGFGSEADSDKPVWRQSIHMADQYDSS